MTKGRILWLLNHSALLNREVPILVELGYEVFIPKIAMFDVSANVTYEFDSTLTIPHEALEKLNQVDFYSSTISQEIMEIMNKYFDVCLFIHNTNVIQSLLSRFEGILGYRAFGRISAEGTHTDFVINSLGVGGLKKIEELNDRFFFLQISENIAEIECDCFKKRARYVPVGFEKNAMVSDIWQGNTNQLLFVCPRIKMSGYFEKTYRTFSKEFAGIPYVIAGSQPIKVENDEHVLGYLSKEEYQALFKNCKVMFYHSQEKRHIHYHPLEAIMSGMPLVYMAHGHLDCLGGEELPGRCETIEEARKKIKSILKGNKKLIDSIRKTQPILVEKYMYDYCKEKWESALEEMYSVLSKKRDKKEVKKKRIAIILPQEYTGGVLDYTLRLVSAIKKGAELSNDSIEIVLGYKAHSNFDKVDYFNDVECKNVKVREFEWEEISNARANEMMSIMNLKVKKTKNSYVIMNDGMNYFADCDYWLFTADRIPGHLFSLRPYGVIAHDYIQRYLPNIVDSNFEHFFIEAARNADAVYTTTDITKNDCIQYAGVSERKVHLLPLFFEEIEANGSYSNKHNYFLWSTNANEHKNHKTILRALEKYYADGGELDCYMTGVNTEKFNVKKDYSGKIEYIEEIRQIIKNNKALVKHIKIWGNLPKEKYLSLLQSAEFFLHAGYADNGNGTAFDAAMLNTPTISSDYPAMRNMDKVLGINMLFFDKKDDKQLAKLLSKAEKSTDEMKKKLPSIEHLRKFTVQDDECCLEIYNSIKNNSIF